MGKDQTENIIKKLDAVLKECGEYRFDYSKYDTDPPAEYKLYVYGLLCTAIDNYCPPNSIQSHNAVTIISKTDLNVSSSVVSAIKRLYGIVEGIRFSYQNTLFEDIKAIVRADVFEDFIEMAEYLLSERYIGPASVVIGIVLEGHLKQLCVRHKIDTTFEKDGVSLPKRAESLNSDLLSQKVYDKGDSKQVTAWLDIRNKGAHGEWDKITKEQVDLMIRGVRHFISRFSV